MTAPYRSTHDAAAANETALSPIANLGALFPRPHPSADTVRILGVLALLTGPLAGVPAILLGRLVERETTNSNGRIIGVHRLFVSLGWTGTYGGTLLLLYLVASSSAGFAMFLVIMGAVAGLLLVAGSTPRAPQFLSAWNGLVRRSPVLASVPILGVLLTGAAGYVTKRGADEQALMEAARRCEANLHAADEALADNRFIVAGNELSAARGVCTGAALDVVSQRLATLVEREAADRKRRDEEAAAERAREAEKREKEAVEARATSARDADAVLRKAETLAAQRRWEDAAGELRGADVALSLLRSLRPTSDVLDPLEKRSGAVRGRITPGLEQIQKVREAQTAAEERRRAAQEAAVARQEAAAARESDRVLVCRDGSTSGCSCAGSHRGCCSHHGGVAGCQ